MYKIPYAAITKSLSRYRISAALLLAVGLLLALPTSAQAFETRSGATIMIDADEVVNNSLIVQAEQFTLDGTVNGSLTVIAASITINGEVNGTLNAIGEIILIDGEVNGVVNAGGRSIVLNGTMSEARLAAREVLLDTDAQVDRSALVGAASLVQRAGSRVEQDLVFAGLYASLAGSIGEQQPTSGADVDQPTRFITWMDGTPGTDGVVAAPTAQGETTEERQGVILIWLGNLLRGFASLLIIGLLLLWLMPTMVRESATHLIRRPLPSLLWGVVAIPVLLISPLVLIFGLFLLGLAFNSLGLGDLVGYTMVLGSLSVVGLITGIFMLLGYVGTIIAGHALAHWYFQRFQPALAGRHIVALLSGLAVLSILGSLPQVGFVINLVATLLGLGALWLYWRRPTVQQPAPEIAPMSSPISSSEAASA